MRPVIFSRALVAGATGAICASQTTAGAGPLLINGTLASGGVATLDVQRTIAITSGGNDAAVIFTVKGTDQQGRPIGETITGVSTNTVSSVLNYLTVTSITASAAVVNAVTVDTVGTGASQEVVLDLYLTPLNAAITCTLVSGAANVTMQYTTDNIFDGTNGPYGWTTVTGLSGISATTYGSITTPATALRLLTNSGTGTFRVAVAQAGIFG